MKSLSKIVVCAGVLLITACSSEVGETVDLETPINASGLVGFEFGKTVESLLGRSFSPSLDPGPHGEQFISLEIKDTRFGFDSLGLGFTMESQRLCRLSLIRNFCRSDDDAVILNMASNVYAWIRSSFGSKVIKDFEFDLHSPPKSLYASVTEGTLELELKVSRRSDMPLAWLELSLIDRALSEVASLEYGHLSNDDAVRESVKSDKECIDWFVPLVYALPIYSIGVLPVFMVVLLLYIGIMIVRHIRPIRVLSWLDPIALILAPYVWAALEHVGQGKSLSNLLELALIGWGWCLCLVVRYTLSVCQKRRFERWYGLATFLTVLTVSVLLAVFFPILPE